MDANNGNRFVLELRFWDRSVTEGVLGCLARDLSVRTLDRRLVDTEAWVRMEVRGDVRQIDALRRLGRKLGFQVGHPTQAAA